MSTVEQQIEDLLVGLTDYVAAEIVQAARTEAGYGEFALAVENLCERLYEANVTLRSDDIAALADLAGVLGLRSERWEFVELLADGDDYAASRKPPPHCG